MITNVKVYGIEESMVRAGYPMDTTNNPVSSDKRCTKLAQTPSGSGHDCFLKGIVVQMDITASHNFWLQWQRYHFNDIISSQSKQHRITKFDIKSQCNSFVLQDTVANLKLMVGYYNEWDYYESHERDCATDECKKDVQDFKNEVIEFFIENNCTPPKNKSELYNFILYNVPCGMNLTAGVTTNYLQLKSQYNQRKNHTLPEWKIFCDWVETLPYKEWIVGK